VWEYSGSGNPTTPYSAVHGSVYPIAIDDEGEEDHYLVTFSNPFSQNADVVIADANGDQVKVFSWGSSMYRATPMGVGTFGERAVDTPR
jgi:hypothetical protein